MLVRRLLDGETVTHEGPVYRMHDALCTPRPVQVRLPIMIGGSGPKKTLRTLARYGDQWNSMGTVDKLPSATRSCASTATTIGRDEAEIERTTTVDIVIRDTPRGRARLLPGAARGERRGVRPRLELLRRAARRDRRGPAADPGAGLPPRAHRHARAVRHRDARADRRAGRAAQRVTAPSAVVALAGGVGGAKLAEGLAAHRRRSPVGRRQHRRRLRAARPARHARPRHRAVQPRRHRAGRVGLGHRGRHARDDGAAGAPTARRTGSRSATAISRSTSPGPPGCARGAPDGRLPRPPAVAGRRGAHPADGRRAGPDRGADRRRLARVPGVLRPSPPGARRSTRCGSAASRPRVRRRTCWPRSTRVERSSICPVQPDRLGGPDPRRSGPAGGGSRGPRPAASRSWRSAPIIGGPRPEGTRRPDARLAGPRGLAPLASRACTRSLADVFVLDAVDAELAPPSSRSASARSSPTRS